MLHNVPTQINKAKRAVTIRHPNAYKAICLRKEYQRISADEMGGRKTLGGMGVLSGEDEHEVDWIEKGVARVLFVDQFAGSQFIDAGTSVDYDSEGYLASIEALTEGEFTPKKNDVFYLYDGGVVAIAYEIVGLPSPVGIYPHVPHYTLQKRDDLNYIPAFTGIDKDSF